MGPKQWFAGKVQEWRHTGATWRYPLITVTVPGTALIVYLISTSASRIRMTGLRQPFPGRSSKHGA